MRVHLIKKQTVEDFVKTNVQSRNSFEDWLEKIKYADWEKPDDIKATYGSADLLGKSSNRIVFDIGGNNYRMICKYFLVRSRYIYLYAGSVHMQHMIDYAERMNNTQ